jgi:predicted secreted protein
MKKKIKFVFSLRLLYMKSTQKTVKLFNSLLIIIVSNLSLSSAQVDTLWTKTFGGIENENPYDLQQTSDGGYIIIATTVSFGSGSSDIWLIKTDSSGNAVWTKTFGGNFRDYGFSVQQTTDGGYILIGAQEIEPYQSDIWLIKTDSSGNSVWTKTFGGIYNDFGASVQQTTDEGYILLGSKGIDPNQSDFWLIKTDASGGIHWTKTFGTVLIDQGIEVKQTIEGDYILLGYSSIVGKDTCYLYKTDNLGNIVWKQKYEGGKIGIYQDVANSFQQTTDGGYIIAGSTNSFGAGEHDVWLIKTDSFGDTLWTRTIGGIYSDGANSVQQTSDGNFIVAGRTRSFGAGESDVWLVKTNAFGDTIWTKTFGGIYGETAYSIKLTNDGRFIIAASTSSFGAGGIDVWLIKANENVTEMINYNTMSSDFLLEQNYPNPFNPTTKIKFSIPSVTLRQAQSDITVTLRVFDVLGNEVATLVNEVKQPGTYEVEFNVAQVYRPELSSGIYFYQLKAGEFTQTKKMLLLK